MNRMRSTVATLVVVAGISLGAAITPVITAVTSTVGRGSPDVFHCC